MLKPLVHATFPLAETGDAMDLMERREHFGKILLIP
jgi:NADPH:quinone reductase-like Zn-dependent oxidoreductase